MSTMLRYAEDHPRLPGPDDYWACRQPERPYNYNHTWFSEFCRPCVIALGAAAVNCPGEMILTAATGTIEPLTDAYDRERRRHQLPPLATAARTQP